MNTVYILKKKVKLNSNLLNEIKHIKSEREYFVVNIDGKFYCTADNVTEAVKEIEDYYKGGKLNENKSTQ